MIFLVLGNMPGHGLREAAIPRRTRCASRDVLSMVHWVILIEPIAATGHIDREERRVLLTVAQETKLPMRDRR
jgi:hypothetical protein